jgi:hypothetical protein
VQCLPKRTGREARMVTNKKWRASQNKTANTYTIEFSV